MNTSSLFFCQRKVDIDSRRYFIFESASIRNSDSNTVSSNDYVNHDNAKIESYILENKETKTYNYKEDPCNPLVRCQLYML